MMLTKTIMNVQTEKLQLIEWLVQLQDLTILQRVKELKQDAEVLAYETSLRACSGIWSSSKNEALFTRSRRENRSLAALNEDFQALNYPIV